jgi:hypothetical protein
MTERQELLAEAKELGLSFAKNAKTENIKSAIEQAKEAGKEEVAYIDAGGDGDLVSTPVAPTETEIRSQIEAEFKEKLEEEKRKLMANMEVNLAKQNEGVAVSVVSLGQAKLKARREALKLVRVNITCKDPMKSTWDGEIISAGNDVIGDVKKFIPFNTEDGYHIPQIILNVLKAKDCTVFVRKKINGQSVNVGKQIKAYSFEYLEPLTTDELSILAEDQAARQAID